jgi:quercetin dioxygenase-like cupin family protein
MIEVHKKIIDHVGARPDKGFKATLFETPRIMLGMNCLEPGQEQKAHDHPDQDKFYCVTEGVGEFLVGEATFTASAGEVVFAPAGIAHGVRNASKNRLSMLVGITPWKSI